MSDSITIFTCMNRKTLKMKCKVRNLFGIFATVILFQSCSDGKIPDVSGIPVDITLQRFDQAEFKADTSDVPAALQKLNSQFPSFTNDFTSFIIGIGKVTDSLSPQAQQAFRYFVNSYRPVFDSLQQSTADLSQTEKELEQAFRYLKHYFPEYKTPSVTTYIGPFDAPGVALTENTMAIGLQLFGGKGFFYYKTPQGLAMFPEYISRRFEKAYIPVNAMRAVIDDLYPPAQDRGTLIDQVIQGGKEWHLLDLLLPLTADTLKTGYTKQQTEFCEKNEAAIWNTMMKMTDLYTVDPEMIRMFVGEAPNTESMSESSPGNIGQWVGRQIVRKYLKKHGEIKVDSLMKLDNRKLFQEAGYKPK